MERIQNSPQPNEWGQNGFNEWVKTLDHPAVREFMIHQKSLLPIIGAFGTTAGRNWRDDMNVYYSMMAEERRIAYEPARVYFDPVITGRDWTPEDAVNEAEHLAKDAVILHGLETKASSVGSMLELGFLAAASVLNGRKMISFIKDTDPSLGPDVQRARSMSIRDGEYIANLIPQHFKIVPVLKTAADEAWKTRQEFLDFLESPIDFEIIEKILPRDDVIPQVCISGTSKGITASHDTPERIAVKQYLEGCGISFFDTVRPDWSISIYENEELPLKDRSLVNTVIITDTTSFGAVKDVGLAVFRAIVNGTYALIHFPADTDPAHKKSDYNRARTLALSHFKKLSEEFPWISHYVRFMDSAADIGKYAEAIIDKNRDA